MKNTIMKRIPDLLLAAAIIIYIFFKNHPSNIFTPILIFLSGLVIFVKYINNKNKGNKEGSINSLMVSIMLFIMYILLLFY